MNKAVTKKCKNKFINYYTINNNKQNYLKENNIKI
jgi:hypothetical protein